MSSMFDVRSVGLSSLSEVISNVRELAVHGTEAVKSAAIRAAASAGNTQFIASLPPRRRQTLFHAFDEVTCGDHRWRVLLQGLVDGFQIIEISSTRSARLIYQSTESQSNQKQVEFDDQQLIANQGVAQSAPIGIIRLLSQPTDSATSAAPLSSTTNQPSLGLSHSSPSPLSLANPLSPPQQPQPPPYYGTLLAVCSAEDRPLFPRSVVKIYSLSLGRYVHLLRFRSKIVGLHTHFASHILVVALESELHVYTTPRDGKSLNFECIWSTRILPNPSPTIHLSLLQSLGPQASSILGPSALLSKDEWSVCALSKRWVAYCPNEPLPPHIIPAASGVCYDATHDLASGHPQNSTLTSVAANTSESLGSMAKALGTGLYNLGGAGRKHLANYLHGDSAQAESNAVAAANAANQQVNGVDGADGALSGAAASVLGTVLIRDIPTQRVIACIKAHPNTQITHMAFDRSGTLLATAPVDGQYIHIYQLVMIPQPVAMDAAQAAAAATQGSSGSLSGSPSLNDLHPLHHSPFQSSRRSSLSHSPALHPTAPLAAAGIAPPVFFTRFLYRLFRGITHASIRDISFSCDSKFVSITSAKGTTHVYAIHPILGGEATFATHGGCSNGNGVECSTNGGGDENGAIQFLVNKYSVLKQQQIQAFLDHDREAEIATTHALDSFLYQPKTLSAISRIKPTGVQSQFPLGVHVTAPMYQPVIAAFDVLESGASSDGSTHGRGSHHHSKKTTQHQNQAPAQQLLVSNWSEELCTFNLVPSFPTASENGSAAAVGTIINNGIANSDLSSASQLNKAKLNLGVEQINTFDLLPSNASQNELLYSHLSPSPQPHLTHPVDQNGDEEPMVRILTSKSQEDEVNVPVKQQQLQQPPLHSAQYAHLQPHQIPFKSASATSSVTNSPKLQAQKTPTLNFFQQLDAQRMNLATQTASNSPLLTPAQAGAPLSSTSANNSPQLQSQQQQQMSRWLSQIELRTHQNSGVPVWASPQFTLKSYERSSAASNESNPLYIEQLGSKPLHYDKFATFDGLQVDGVSSSAPASVTTTATSSSSSSSSSTAAAAAVVGDVENEISAALESSMLDDAGFMASIHASTVANANRSFEEHKYPSASLSSDANLNSNGGAATTIFGLAGSSNRIDEDYYMRAPAAAPAAGASSASANNPSASSMMGESTVMRSNHMTSSTLQASSLFNASASEILSARLPPTHVEDSIVFGAPGGLAPPHSNDPSDNSISPPTVHASTNNSSGAGAAAGGNKKKKKKGKLKAQEMNGSDDEH